MYTAWFPHKFRTPNRMVCHRIPPMGLPKMGCLSYHFNINESLNIFCFANIWLHPSVTTNWQSIESAVPMQCSGFPSWVARNSRVSECTATPGIGTVTQDITGPYPGPSCPTGPTGQVRYDPQEVRKQKSKGGDQVTGLCGCGCTWYCL